MPERKTPREDLIDLFDYAWDRLEKRLTGLSDDEWVWRPTSDDQIGIAWRLSHIRNLLTEPRNWTWLGADAPSIVVSEPKSADEAIMMITEAYATWRALLAATTESAIAAPIGAPAGAYGDASRYSFALHMVDELIHHAAETALFRDLYEALRTD
jgi:DinB superfamily